MIHILNKLYHTGSRITFEFPSLVNLFGPSFYRIARTLSKQSRHSIGLAGATRLTRSDFRFNFLLLEGQRWVNSITVFRSVTKSFQFNKVLKSFLRLYQSFKNHVIGDSNTILEILIVIFDKSNTTIELLLTLLTGLKINIC